MKKLLLVMLASLFMLTSCDLTESDDGSATNAAEIVGTWENIDGVETTTLTLTSDTFEMSTTYSDGSDDDSYTKGSFSVTSSKITTTTTLASDDGVTWSTEEDISTLMVMLYMAFGANETDATTAVEAELELIFSPMSADYTLSGDTLIIAGVTYTRQ